MREGTQDSKEEVKPRSNMLTQVLIACFVIIFTVVGAVALWIYIDHTSFQRSIMKASKYIRYEILKEEKLQNGPIIPPMTRKELSEYFANMSEEERSKYFSPEKYELFKRRTKEILAEQEKNND